MTTNHKGLGLEFGPVKVQSEDHEAALASKAPLSFNFSAAVVQVSSAEAKSTYENIAVGSVLFRINGTCVEHWPFDKCVQRLSASSSSPSNTASTGHSLRLEFLVPSRSFPSLPAPDPPEHNQVYQSSWVFLPPNWVLDAENGRIWQLGLDLGDLSRFDQAPLDEAKSAPEVCEFLMRRANADPKQLREALEDRLGHEVGVGKTYAKHVLLELIRLQLREEKSELLNTSILFKTINGVYLQALRERSGLIQAKAQDSSATMRDMKRLSPEAQGSGSSRGKGLLIKSGSKEKERKKGKGRASAVGVGGGLGLGSVRSQRLLRLRAASFKRSRDEGERRDVSSFAAMNEAILVEFLEDFTKADGIPLKDIRCGNGKSVVLQIDLFTNVFLKLLPREKMGVAGEKSAHLRWISHVVAEYVRSLHYHFIPIEQYIFELLAWLMIMSNQEHELHQLLLFQIPTPSSRLAETLLSASVRYEPFWQIAIHMLFQLKDYRLVLAALLNKQHLFQALHLLLRFPDLLQDDQGKERSVVRY